MRGHKRQPKYKLKVSENELGLIADGLRTVQSRYRVGNNQDYKRIEHMLYVIDDIRGFHDKVEVSK